MEGLLKTKKFTASLVLLIRDVDAVINPAKTTTQLGNLDSGRKPFKSNNNMSIKPLIKSKAITGNQTMKHISSHPLKEPHNIMLTNVNKPNFTNKLQSNILIEDIQNLLPRFHIKSLSEFRFSELQRKIHTCKLNGVANRIKLTFQSFHLKRVLLDKTRNFRPLILK